MAAQTAEQVYAVFEALLRGLTAADPPAKPTLSALALRTGLHPLLTPFREDPLRTLSGEFVSLDVRVMSLYDEIAQAPYAHSLFRDLPADDLWALGEPPNVTNSDNGVAAVGGVGGALYLPSLGHAIPCRIRAFHTSGDDPDRAGWDPPVAVRPVALAIQSSAEKAFRAALLFLESRSLLPASRLPGTVYFDVSGARLEHDLAQQVSGDSLELPLLLAFLSALSGESIGESVAATGAVESPRTGQDIDFRPVGHVSEKAAAFQASFPTTGAVFLAAETPGAIPSPGTVFVATLKDALPHVFPSWVTDAMPTVPEINASGVPSLESVEAPVYLCAVMENYGDTCLAPSETAEWRQLIESAVRRQSGVTLAHFGNTATESAVFARFSTASAALGAAESLLQALRFHPWSPGHSVEHRQSILPGIGIHRVGTDSGTVTPNATDGWRHAIRIAESANAGQVLLSAGARAAILPGAEKSETVITVLGNYRLRDLAPPAELSQAQFALVDSVGQPIRARRPRPPQSLDSYAHNLPFQLTPTFGREPDVDTIRRLICGQTSASRMLSIVGGGGVGKTRVALEAAASSLAAFPDGAWFVPITGEIHTAEDVAVRVVETLPFEIRVDRAASPTNAYQQALAAAAADLRILLILDGSETYDENLAVSTFASALAQQCLSVRILVTARNRLRIAEETCYALQPLAVVAPDRDFPNSPTPAEALFCARARVAAPSFALAVTADRLLVVEICGLLAGLPLAIEIAAAHVAAVPLAEIASGIGLLSAGTNRTLPPMNRLFAWAFDLLELPVQRLLCALSTFADGFDNDAATAMAGAELAADDALRLLEDRSLIRTRGGEAGRYDLHSSIREFARRKLTESGRESQVRADNARYFTALAARYGADEPNAERERIAFDRLELDLNNLRATIDFLCANEPGGIPKMVVDLGNFLRYRGHLKEWRAWPALALRFLTDGPERPTALYAQVHLCRAAAFVDIDRPDDADRHLDIVYDVATAIEAWGLAAKALNQRSLLRSRAKQWDEAIAALQEARVLNRRIHSEYGEIVALNQLGIIAARQSKFVEAQKWYTLAANLSRAIDDRRGLAIAVGNLGYMALEENDYAAAQRHFEEGLAEGRGLHDATRVAHGLVNLGDVLNRQKQWDSGTPLLAIAEAMLTRQRHPSLGEATRLLAVAEVHFGTARLADLRREFSRMAVPQLMQIDTTRYVPRQLRLMP